MHVVALRWWLTRSVDRSHGGGCSWEEYTTQSLRSPGRPAVQDCLTFNRCYVCAGTTGLLSDRASGRSKDWDGWVGNLPGINSPT